MYGSMTDIESEAEVRGIVAAILAESSDDDDDDDDDDRRGFANDPRARAASTSINATNDINGEGEEAGASRASSAQDQVWKYKEFVAVVLSVMVVMVGATIFYYVEENLPFGDAIYFIIITLTTIGFGDLAPDSTGGRIFFICFIPFGLAAFGLCISIIALWFMKGAAKARRRLARSRAFRKATPFALDTNGEQKERKRWTPQWWLTKFCAFCLSPQHKIGMASTALVLLVGAGVGAFMLTEHWDFVTSLYFCMVTLTTVGYGDITPQSIAGRVIVCFYALASLGMATVVLGELGDWMVRQVEERLRLQRLRLRRKRQQSMRAAAANANSPDLTKLLEQISTLPLHDKRQLRSALDEQLSRLERLRSAGSAVRDATPTRELPTPQRDLTASLNFS